MPFALENLLPAGTVLLELVCEAGQAIHAAHSNDWGLLSHFVNTNHLQLSHADDITRRELDFLMVHDFLRATWRCEGRYIYVRVYLVPFDLPGVHGCLRHRDEAKVLLPGRKALFSLLGKTDRCVTTWLSHTAYRNPSEPFIRPSSDSRTLSEIFADLPSPVVDDSSFLSGSNSRIRTMYRNVLHGTSPPGMRPLYPYQRRTVARMIQQELDPGVALDPLYIPVTDVCETKTFYLQPTSLELLCEPPMRAQAKGGILCEEMGTGKTCIVLALIMATKHQLPAPEDSPWNTLRGPQERPVLTPLAFRHFRSSQFCEARSASRMKNPEGLPLPTLVELLTHIISTSPERLGPPECHSIIEQQPHLWGPVKRNLPFYLVYEDIPATSSPRRKGEESGPRKVYLTSATLIVVPRAIMAQWLAEINKHCDGGSLRLLALDNGERSPPVPPVHELMSQYDVVLITHERFAAEKKRCNPMELYSWKHCECEDPQGTRVPHCTCSMSNSVSPFVQIRWKRLVVDEGHVSAAKNNLAELAQELSVERRWIVSGTPTRNLMGLSLGRPLGPSVASEADTDQESNSCSDEDEELRPDVLLHPDDTFAQDSIEGTSAEGTPEGTVMDVDDQKPRPWTRVDSDDLNRLGDMISRFIGVPQFAREKDVFRRHVATPLLDRNGPTFAAIQVVSQVMAQVMFRHQISTIEQDLPDKLPPLKEKTVTLKFQPLAAKTYNVLQSLIAINAVDSERKHQDYLFHPGNRSHLKAALENLTQTMFWRTDKQMFDIDNAVERSEKALELALERGRPDSDIALVKESIRVQKDAAQDNLWRDVMHHEDLPFVVRGLSPMIQNAWLKLGASPRENGVSVLDPDRITKLRQILNISPLISEERLMDHGFVIAQEDKENAIKHEEYVKSLKRKRRIDDDLPVNPKLRKENLKAGSKEKLLEINREFKIAISQKENGSRDAYSSEQRISVNDTLASSMSLTVKIGNSLSPKVNYILKKVLQHSKKEKFLIFSAFPLSLAYIAEALQVVQVPYLQYTFGVKARVRQQIVVTFETSEKYRVLLMELKLGARGLNLVTASRIIFCEPVWQGDLESQAIKRAHRIGQKNDKIKVSTLIMQGTSEEVMLTRRHALKRKWDRLPALEQDVGMRKFLENPTFLSPKDLEPHAFEVPGIDVPLLPRANPTREQVTADDCNVQVQNPTSARDRIATAEEDDEPPLKSIKTSQRIVRFI